MTKTARLRALLAEMQGQHVELLKDNPDNPAVSFYGYWGYSEILELVTAASDLLDVVDKSKKLYSEVIGMYNTADMELREIIGNTNVSVLVSKLLDVKEALAKLDAQTQS